MMTKQFENGMRLNVSQAGDVQAALDYWGDQMEATTQTEALRCANDFVFGLLRKMAREHTRLRIIPKNEPAFDLNVKLRPVLVDLLKLDAVSSSYLREAGETRMNIAFQKRATGNFLCLHQAFNPRARKTKIQIRGKETTIEMIMETTLLILNHHRMGSSFEFYKPAAPKARQKVLFFGFEPTALQAA